jgi:hypothetical protein
MAGIFRDRGKAAMPLLGSRIDFGFDRFWVGSYLTAFGRQNVIAAVEYSRAMRRLSTQTRSSTNISDDVFFHRKPPCGFQDRDPNQLMTSTGSSSAFKP